MSEYNDKELLALFKDVEKRNYAFNLIVRKYQEKLYWHIRKIVIKHEDSNDILQNTFIKVWKGLDGFREDSKLYTWLYRIATNESLTFLKQQKTKYLLPIVDYENNLKETLVSDVYFNGNEIQCKLQKAVLDLPEKQRIVFNMKYFDEMKYDDMSKILETSVGALKASYHHAVKKIEKYFTED
ncbi:MAG: RNA polymerase sigma factor [Bacteroidales bacterium]|jgi:RNA polymerase sigma factor (sigma-70 family)|nr:RNA polymerase sigma factor [Bacteroidales bacterium]